MEGIYEIRHSDELCCHTALYNNWIRHSKVNRWDSDKHRQRGDPISLLLSSKYKGSELKMVIGEIGWSSVDRTYFARDKDKWRALVNTVMNMFGNS
jgi:hypothetical protein